MKIRKLGVLLSKFNNASDWEFSTVISIARQLKKLNSAIFI